MIKQYLKTPLLLLALCSTQPASAQDWIDYDAEGEPHNLLSGIELKGETQVSVSNNQTPLWLNANKHGLSSLEKNNAYIRGSVIRPLQQDSLRHWAIGYGLDIVAPIHYTSNVIVQQAFAQARWLHGVLSIGAMELPMELKNQTLSTGSQTIGINARPIPQVRLALGDYWVIPATNGWLRIKGHIAYGKFTDDNWQTDFTQQLTPYTQGALFHSKAGYLKIGNPERFYPLTVEMGLEMAAQYGGKCYYNDETGTMAMHQGHNGLHGMWRAFWPGGADYGETTYQNAEGNQLGSWVMRINYNADTWQFSLYADKYFEDHSSMLQLDYDGYGQGEEWNTQKERRYFLYDFKDIMLGAELQLKYNPIIRTILAEYLYSKYQSGPIYHDHTNTISDHIGGKDNFYNHFAYVSWQHWGQVIGNPLYLSPIYNTNGKIDVQNNRVKAFHLGIDGNPTENTWYRLLATWQEGLGTYDAPYLKKKHNVSTMLEIGYNLPRGGWQLKGAFGADCGSLLGHNYGGQLTLSKTIR